MALVSCPKCGYENTIDIDECCPQCGCSVKDHVRTEKEKLHEEYQRKLHTADGLTRPDKPSLGDVFFENNGVLFSLLAFVTFFASFCLIFLLVRYHTFEFWILVFALVCGFISLGFIFTVSDDYKHRMSVHRNWDENTVQREKVLKETYDHYEKNIDKYGNRYGIKKTSVSNIPLLIEQYTLSSVDWAFIYNQVSDEITAIKAKYDIQTSYDIAATEIITALSAIYVRCSWIDVKMFCELIPFDKISQDAADYIGEILLGLISEINVYDDGSWGRLNTTVFFYPLYEILNRVGPEIKEKLMKILNETYSGNQTAYDKMVTMYKNNSGKSGLQEKRYNSAVNACRESKREKESSDIGFWLSAVALGLFMSDLSQKSKKKNGRR